MSYQGEPLSQGYILSTSGIDAGVTAANSEGFAFVALGRASSGGDWKQPLGNVSLTGNFSADGFRADLPLLINGYRH
jgi:hypothetical protein